MVVDCNDFRLYKSYLAHYGVKGMHWGIRRYQNPDGTLTQLGKSHYRHKSYNKDSLNAEYTKALDDIYNSLSDEDKKYLNVNSNKDYVRNMEHKYWLQVNEPKMSGLVTGGLIYDKNNKKPVGFIDITKSSNNAHVDIVISKQHRGKGLSSELIKQYIGTLDKFGNNNKDIQYLDWVVHKDNKASIHLAEKIGFEKPSEENEKGFITYTYENPYYKK